MTDIRTVRTITAIRETFIKMIIEKDDVFFSIKEIAERANINRKTFYLHFECIEDLYADLEETTEDKLLNILEENGFFENKFSVEVILRSLIELINQNNKLYEKLLISDEYKFLFRNVKNKIKEKITSALKLNGNDLKIDMCAEYVCLGLMKLFRVWVKRKDEMSEEELIEVANCIITSGITGIYEQMKTGR